MSYLKEVVFTAIICGIFTKLPLTEKEGSGKYVKYAASLLFLFVLVTPLVGNTEISSAITDSLSQIGGEHTTVQESESTAKTQLQIVTEALCNAAAENAAEKFGVSADTFAFRIIYSFPESGEMTIKKAQVYSSNTELNKTEVKNYFENLFGCPTEVLKNE